MATVAIQLGHNATVGISLRGKIVGVLSQEKVDNHKNSSAFPARAILDLLEECALSVSDVDRVVVCGNYIVPNFLKDDPNSFKEYSPGLLRKILRPIKGRLVKTKLASVYYRLRYKRLMSEARHVDRDLTSKLLKIGIEVDEIMHVDHHTCHAYSAANFFSNLDSSSPVLIFTLDGEGDDIAGSIWKKSGDSLEKLMSLPIDCSMGHLYSGFTKYLGMTPLEHEYKVMGLSAYCKERYVIPVYKNLLEKKIKVIRKLDCYSIQFDFDATQTEDYLIKSARGIRFDNLAGAVQMCTEKICLEWIEKNIDLLGVSDIAVSGGVFMNVKLNKKIQESKKVRSVKFLPSCGDESNVIGALYFATSHKYEERLEPLDNMYCGVSIKDIDIENQIIKRIAPSGAFCVRRCDDINAEVAKLIADGEVVGRVEGRNEWGARSLGNRAILAHPSRLESFYTINDLIKARDFWMPFAPSILDTHAREYLRAFDPSRSYPYAMITAYDTTEVGVVKLRAGIHQGDHTCRPQIVTRLRNPNYYDLIQKFNDLTGVGALVNTSLNIHGYPLAATLEQAVWTFLNSELRFIAINDYLLRKNG